MSTPIPIPQQRVYHTQKGVGAKASSGTSSGSSGGPGGSSGGGRSRKHKIIRSISPSYININSIKLSNTNSPGVNSVVPHSYTHPLDVDDESDSESVFDESFENSSVSSSNSSINSSLYKSSSSPLHVNLKSKCHISLSSATTSSSPVPSPSESVNLSPSKPSGKGSMAFQKLHSFDNRVVSRPSALSLFRTNSSRLSKPTTKPSYKSIHSISIKSALNDNDPKILDDTLPSIELQTFKLENPLTYLDTIKVPRMFKHRDERINSNFLKLYAIDYSSRVSNILPNSNNDFIPINQLKFHHDNNLYKLSLSSRDKLWENIILPPRLDRCPTPHVDHTDYIFIGSPTDHHRMKNNSLTMKNGNILPWSNNSRPSLKPSGVLKGKKSLANGPNPNSGVTSCQYTIKGWCNSRWLDSSSE